MQIASCGAGAREAEFLPASLAATARRNSASHATAPGAMNTASIRASYAAWEVHVLLKPATGEAT